MVSRKIVIGLWLILFAMLAVIVLFWIHERNGAPVTNTVSGIKAATSTNQQTPATPTTQLLSRNPDFVKGLINQQNGNYEVASSSYRKAIAEETDPLLAGQIEFYLAVTDESSGDYPDAIKLYKEIIANNPKWNLMQAYAVQGLATMHYTYLGVEDVTKQIFSTPPYNSFGPSATTSQDIAYRNLYQYAASFYPLGIAETRIAFWYASDLHTTLHDATTSPQGVEYMKIITDALVKAEADVQRIQGDPVAGSDIPEILAREGVVLGYLAKMGVVDPAEGQEPSTRAVNYQAASSATPGMAQFYQAVYLLYAYGKAKAPEIHTALSVFVPHAKVNQYMPSEFIDARTDQKQLGFRGWLVDLARIDSSFKSYLISLGWKQADFSS